VQKPINLFALALWLVAAIYLVADVTMYLFIRGAYHRAIGIPGSLWQDTHSLINFWNAIRLALLGAGQLAALGTIIELLDSIIHIRRYHPNSAGSLRPPETMEEQPPK
jgi:hypothetical protein